MHKLLTILVEKYLAICDREEGTPRVEWTFMFNHTPFWRRKMVKITIETVSRAE